MSGTVKCFVEPFQAAVEHCLRGYNSAAIVGDVDNAMLNGLYYCVAYFFVIPDLVVLQRNLTNFLHQMVSVFVFGIYLNLFRLIIFIFSSKKG